MQEGNYRDLADMAGRYSYDFHNMPDEKDLEDRKKYARLALLAAGEAAVDAVGEIFTREEQVKNGKKLFINHCALAEILIASKSRRAALPLLTQFRAMSPSLSEVEKMIHFFVEMKAVEVAPGLVDLLKSDSWGARYLAAKALGMLEIPETTEALLKALEGDPHVRQGLEDVGRSQFTWSILATFEVRRRATGPKVESMSEADMLKIMQSFASAYLRDDTKIHDQLEFTVKDIGKELYRRGGEAAMQKMIQQFSGSASRHIDRVWSGIGGWQG